MGARQSGFALAPDVACVRNLIANFCFMGRPGAGDGDWVLVDAGVPGAAWLVERAVREQFGSSRPAAILLTHGHFDHVGALAQLADRWNVPVYAHVRELPFLTGEANYPPPDPSAGRGLMSVLSPLYPRKGINLGRRVQPLPAGGEVPGAPHWQWIPTPGHTPGHVSFFRERDRVLIAGDAFTTVQQESALAVLAQRQAVHGPPAYFTTDWRAAGESVRRLEALRPAVAATGHGVPMRGERLARELAALARDFDRAAVPEQGRYVARPDRYDPVEAREDDLRLR